MRRLIEPIRQRLLNRRAYILAGELARSIQQLSRVETRMVSLAPAGPERGRVLLSYIVDPFLLPPDDPQLITHTHYWESRRIAELWAEAGYAVDIIHWTNRRFVPQRRYDICIDVRHNLERLAPLLGPRCLRVQHIETGHWLFHTTAQHQRLLDIQRRRGVTLPPDKQVLPNRAIEHADCATILGNAFTQSTYAYAGKPLYRIPISTPVPYPWPEQKDFDACRRQFIWIGSSGFAHKGLDLVLEAFAGMPEMQLAVCGPTKSEPHFLKLYHRELFETQNIRTVGWVNITGPEFTSLADRSLALIYPSCSEGGGGIAITCMHAGLIPIVSAEASVDVSPATGVELRENTIAAIQAAARDLAARPADQLRDMARAAWAWARATHTKETFSAAYRDAIAQMLAGREQLMRSRA
jgi:glycosyltransferase involved in cell wall biosynthesis